MGLRAVLVVAAVVVGGTIAVYALLGSGGDDNGSSGAEQPVSRAGTPSGVYERGAEIDIGIDTPDERAGAETIERVYNGLNEAIAKGIVPLDQDIDEALDEAQKVDGLHRICDLLSDRAREQTTLYVRRTANRGEVDWTCEKAVAILIRRTREDRGLRRAQRARVVGMNVVGDRATATLSFGKGVPQSTVALVKEDGEWRLADSFGGSRN